MKNNRTSETNRRALEKRKLLELLLKEEGVTLDTAIPRREQTSAPLSYAQQRLWFLDQLDPGSHIYNMPAAMRLSGPMNLAALERSVNEVIRRHETLRTTFRQAEGQPVQVIAPGLTLSMPVYDLSGWPEGQREQEIRLMAKQEARRPFDLATGPLLRATVLRVAEEEHVAFFTMHHIVGDGWSLGLLVQEIATLYAAYAEGASSPLEELPIQYADYAVWQREWLQGEALDAQLAYWRDKLKGAKPRIEMPTDYPRPRQQSYRGARQTIVLPKALVNSLKALSNRRNVTLYVTMLAALKIVLWKWSGQDDLTVGTVIANRNRIETERLIGCFMNFLGLRSQLSGETAALDFLEALKTTVFDAYAHQDCPFEKVVETVSHGSRGEASQNPLSNVAFLLQNHPHSDALNETLKIQPLHSTEADDQAALLDLRLVAEELADQLHLTCEYNTDLFTAETIQHFVSSYCLALETIAAQPEIELARFELTEDFAAAIAKSQHRRIKQTIAVTATFTAEPVADSISFWMDELGLASELSFAPYNQVFQQLLDPSSLLNQNRHGVNVILLRFEDWVRYEQGDAAVPASESFVKIERNARELIAGLKAAAERSATPYIVCLCPASPSPLEDEERAELFQRTEELVCSSLKDVNGVYVVTGAELAATYPVEERFDTLSDQLGHIPYTQLFFTALGTMVSRKIRAAISASYKVLVLDCDETLWGGICGEDGALGIRIDAARRAVQEFAVEQQEAGMLICLCSKNNEADVVEVFEKRGAEMPLKREHLVSWRINWRPKSENLRELAAELQLGLDRFIFIDDNPAECAEVKANCPEALTIQLPPPASDISSFLQHLWVFDALTVTDVDKRRTALYQQHAQRESLRRESPDIKSFLAGLNLRIQITELTPSQLPRAAQLTQRTNQFNATTIRRTEQELQTLLQSDAFECLTVEAGDRFGDYGLVGLMIFRSGADALEVDTFLLSCRALGKEVEHRMLAGLRELAEARNLNSVYVQYRPTKRNQPALEFLRSLSTEFKSLEDGAGVFQFPVKEQPAPELNGPLAETATVAPSEAAAEAYSRAQAEARLDSAQVVIIATKLAQPEQIQQWIEIRNRRARPDLEADYVAPRTRTEEILAGIWKRLLGVERVGIHDDFFSLGGHSLLGTQLISLVRSEFQVEVPLRNLFEARTIARFAVEIVQNQKELAESDEVSKMLEELALISEEEVEALLAEEQDLDEDMAALG
jgi:FkbH-like protein